jgi:hypothetical protein
VVAAPLLTPRGHVVGTRAAQTAAVRPAAAPLDWSGLVWRVRDTAGRAAPPGPNVFSADNVCVYPDGLLHLRIQAADDGWTCAELVTLRTICYSTITFHVASDLTTLPPSAVLGLFVYQDDSHEIDIEFSRWGRPDEDAGQYVLQPGSVASHVHRFSVPAAASSLHSLSWQPDALRFTSLWTPDPPAEPLVEQWTLALPQDIPPPDREHLVLNLWLYQQAPPGDGQPVEVVLAGVDIADAPAQPDAGDHGNPLPLLTGGAGAPALGSVAQRAVG